MKTLKDKVYFPDCSASNCSIDDYYLRDTTFGYFCDEGRTYVVTDRQTPRPWLLYLCNDKIRSAVSNTGKGFIYHSDDVVITKQYELDNYITRNVNGQRELFITDKKTGKGCEFFTEAENFVCKVSPEMVVFEGNIDSLRVTVKIFVPQNAPCECWNVEIKNTASDAELTLTAKQDLYLYKDEYDEGEIGVSYKSGIKSKVKGITNIFAANAVNNVFLKRFTEKPSDTDIFEFLREELSVDCEVLGGNTFNWNVISSACKTEAELAEVEGFTDVKVCNTELSKQTEKWNKIISQNRCELPDKNLEYFLNIWLKKNIQLTARYDRGGGHIGYRDGLQDAWGNLLVEPLLSKEKILFCLRHMLSDGRCPRQIDKKGIEHDMRDFSDSPIWAPIAVNDYIKETGDFSILSEKIAFLDSDKETTAEEHIYLALDYLYHSRGKNGLILMRDGDWADGLSGINRYGADATSVWMTIATFYAQNKMQEIYEEMGCKEKAEIMAERSAEYKKLVNDVGWDGNWFIYGFFEDGEPIGSAKNLEGKIWSNPQSWAIFSGIVDDENRIKRMRRSVSRYLDTPYGAMVMNPPYVFYGERCGRIQRQHPGVFLNGSIYNHSASFKVFADVKAGEYDDAYDTIMRCLPNHPDNSDTRRTSEPFTVGNVYYGPDSERYGMNLFSWFTATPSWLIHGGFEEILGVKSGFNGLKITPHVPEDWTEYSVNKLYRNTLYSISFEKSDCEKGIWVDGVKQSGDTVLFNKDKCEVIVKF